MTFETGFMVFIGTGTVIFVTILLLKHVNIFMALGLALLSILWSVTALKYWGVTFLEQYGWMPILFPVVGIISAMNILSKIKPSNISVKTNSSYNQPEHKGEDE